MRGVYFVLRALLLSSFLLLAACGGSGESSTSPASATSSTEISTTSGPSEETPTPRPSPTTPDDSSITKEIPGFRITMVNPASDWRVTAGRIVNVSNRNISLDASIHPVPEDSSAEETAAELAGQAIEFEEEDGKRIGFALVNNAPTFYVDAGESGLLAVWANMLLARERVPEALYPELREMALSAEIETR